MKAEMRENGADELSKSTFTSKSRDCRSGPGLHAKKISTTDKGTSEGGKKERERERAKKEDEEKKSEVEGGGGGGGGGGGYNR